MNILVTGGGTGGHVYPALTVMKKLHSSGNHRISYVGTKYGLESKVIPKYEWIDFYQLAVRGLSRQSVWRALQALVLLPVALIHALFIILYVRPDVVYGTGGYVTFPVAFWAVILRFPVVTHELNAKPGLTNKLLSPYVDEVFLAYEDAERYLPETVSTTTVGVPVREDVEHPGGNPYEHFDLDPADKTVLVFGGSHGSEVLAGKVMEEIKQCNGKTDMQFIVQSPSNDEGKGLESGTDREGSKLVKVDYLDRIGLAYEASDFVICRGGAGTIAELLVTKKPAFIVPWSGSAYSHQFDNARLLDRAGAAFCLDEENWQEFPLIPELQNLLSSPRRRAKMVDGYSSFNTNGATEQVIHRLHSLSQKGE